MLSDRYFLTLRLLLLPIFIFTLILTPYFDDNSVVNIKTYKTSVLPCFYQASYSILSVSRRVVSESFYSESRYLIRGRQAVDTSTSTRDSDSDKLFSYTFSIKDVIGPLVGSLLGVLFGFISKYMWDKHQDTKRLNQLLDILDNEIKRIKETAEQHLEADTDGLSPPPTLNSHAWQQFREHGGHLRLSDEVREHIIEFYQSVDAANDRSDYIPFLVQTANMSRRQEVQDEATAQALRFAKDPYTDLPDLANLTLDSLPDRI